MSRLRRRQDRRGRSAEDLDYSKRLDANQSISLSAGVTHYSTPMSIVASRLFSASTYYHAAASYSRRPGSRLYGGVNLAGRGLIRAAGGHRRR